MSDVSIIFKLQVIDTQTRWPWVLGVWVTLGPCRSWSQSCRFHDLAGSRWQYLGEDSMVAMVFLVLKATSGFETKSCDGWKGIWGMLTNHFLWRPLVTFYLWDGTLFHVFQWEQACVIWTSCSKLVDMFVFGHPFLCPPRTPLLSCGGEPTWEREGAFWFCCDGVFKIFTCNFFAILRIR